jgi:radical SAM enzyme (TIGR01210 family)
VDPYVPYGFFVEPERAADGRIVDVATVLLSNRECGYTCLMCDLWVNTLTRPVPPGAIPAQIEHALSRLPPARQIKLYNAGSFFDPGAIPPADLPVVARMLAGFERVIVEAHPALVGAACEAFAGMIAGRLEVAMGLETAHPEVLERLNKRMTLPDFRNAAARLSAAGISSRTFVLLAPPYLAEPDGVAWAIASLGFALDCGIGCAVVIPTRAGNGALERLERQGLFTPPRLSSLEEVMDRWIGPGRAGGMRVFADLWDLERIAPCGACRDARRERLRRINLTQSPLPRLSCACETA